MLKKRLLALICGVIFSFGFAPFDLWLLSILSVAVLVGLLNKSTNKEAFLVGYVFGFGMWLSGISWLYVSIHYHGNIGIIGSSLIILIFISILSLYSGFLFLLNNVFESLSPKKIIFLTLPFAWTLMEFLRSYLFTGFPWLISGTMLADTFIDGYTPIIGAQGNSFILILLSVLVYKLYKNIIENRSALLLSLFVLLILLPSYYLKSIEWTSAEDEIQVTLYQPNLTLEDKWSQFGIIKSQGMMEKAIEDANDGDLIVFPETALILSEKDNKPFMNLIRNKSFEKNITLITGIIEREDDYRIRNRLQTLGAMEDVYDKVKLVPFGEFIPLERYLGSFLDIIGLNLTNTLPGEAVKSIRTGKLKISPSICFEIAFDEHIRKTAKDSNILLTVSNDTWFGRSIGPIQHLEIAQNRALEHKKPLIRATNSGISAFVSKNGEIIERQTYFEDKTLTRNIILYSGNTFYSKYGNLPLLIFLILYVSFLSLRKTFSYKY
jgi:apolipoprotein N-acyltransferase